ncbi:MAG TPA: TetR/AcrR family transcriptional regulator [Thiolinea sp.]|nr:TetR/AcrR family transcriptional regulator [Thiolinea sp.]
MAEKLPARERLLNAAAELFYKEGVGATGIDQITTHAGVAKMSLYNNFSSKADLVHAYLQRRHAEWQGLYRERLKQAHTSKERVLAIFDSYTDHAAEAYAWGFRGCGLLNAAAELSLDDPGRAVVALQKAEVEQLFQEYLAELHPNDPVLVAETAEHLSFLLEGAMIRAGLEGHDARLQAVRKMTVSMLEHL